MERDEGMADERRCDVVVAVGGSMKLIKGIRRGAGC